MPLTDWVSEGMSLGERMRIAIASSSDFSLPILDALGMIAGVEVVGFISTPDRPKGRSGRATPNGFVLAIEQHGLPIFKPQDDSELLGALDQLNPDLVVVIAYGRIVKESALSIPRFGWINLHYSLLPKYRGAAPVQRTLIAGEAVFGYSIFQLDPGMDTGPIYLQREVAVSGNQNATDILRLLSRAAAESIPSLIEMLESETSPTPQQGDPSFATKISKEELFLDLRLPGNEIFNRIRALTDQPGAWSRFFGIRIIIHRAELTEYLIDPLSLAVIKGRLILGLVGLSIELKRVTPEGRREMTGAEYARGLRLAEGETRKLTM